MSKNTLRILGTSVSLIEETIAAARDDLDFDIEFEILGGIEVQQKATLQPSEFDICDQWFHSIDLFWTAGSIQPIDLERIDLWDEVGNLTKTGRLNSRDKLGSGANPMEIQFVQNNESLGSHPTKQISALPTTHNTDSFSYNPNLLPSDFSVEEESWSWLLDSNWKGKVGLTTDPSIGIADMALAAQANGLVEFDDTGNMSIEEIDALVDQLIVLKKNNHFKGFWSNLDTSIDFMERRKGMVGGIWSPAAIELRARGLPLRMAAPIEGYRAWHGCLSLSSQLPERKTDAAYQYLNWWLSGKPGAILARQGYYCSIPERARNNLSQAEWDYWYEGLPASENLYDPHGKLIIRPNEIREGGNYQSRMSNIAMWNTLMDEHNYLVRRWNEFLLA